MNQFKPLIKSYKGFYTDMQLQSWKSARWGVIIFCFVHFLYEIGTGNSKALIPIIFNYFISAWFVKKQIKNNKYINNPMLSGIAVSGIVFLARLLIGFIYSIVVLS